MKIKLALLLSIVLVGCSLNKTKSVNKKSIAVNQSSIKNEKLKNYSFLKDMYQDSYFPNFLVDKGKEILIKLCIQIEAENPESLTELYKLTHTATNKFNDLEEEFGENGSELETGARESIGGDFAFIAQAYGFDADIEELIATRNW